jgi:hypothetical protein
MYRKYIWWFILILIFLMMLILCCKSAMIVSSDNNKTIKDNSTIEKLKEGEYLIIYYKDQKWKMPIKEFKAVIKSAELYEEVIKCEKDKRIKIDLEEIPWKITEGTKYESKMTITWLKEDKKTSIKVMTLKVTVSLKKDKYSKAYIIYSEIARWGFPVMLLGFFILLIFI